MDRMNGPLVSGCRVERGLYLLRYVEAQTSPSPRAEIRVLSGSLSTMPAPGRARSVLDDPGQALVILAETAGAFEIQVTAARGGGTDARFSVDLLDAGDSGREAPPDRVAQRDPEIARRADPGLPGPRPADAVRVAVQAHVSRRGDVRAGAGEWVAGPDGVLPIEGLSIATDRPDLGVHVRVQSIDGGQRWSRWHEPGEFSGSRQRADALTAVALALTGDAADRFDIVADVMTLGMPPANRRGQAVEFFGVDPIVGFRFALQPVIAFPPAGGGAQGSPLRVFRAKR